MCLSIHWLIYLRSDTESADVKATKKKNFAIVNLQSLLKRTTEKNSAKDKPAAAAQQPTGQPGAGHPNEEDENAAPSEATVIIEDEPPKKVF